MILLSKNKLGIILVSSAIGLSTLFYLLTYYNSKNISYIIIISFLILGFTFIKKDFLVTRLKSFYAILIVFICWLIFHLFLSYSYDSLVMLLNLILGFCFSFLISRNIYHIYFHTILKILNLFFLITAASIFLQQISPDLFNILYSIDNHIQSERVFFNFNIKRLTGFFINETYPANILSIGIILNYYSKSRYKAIRIIIYIIAIILTGSRLSLILVLFVIVFEAFKNRRINRKLLLLLPLSIPLILVLAKKIYFFESINFWLSPDRLEFFFPENLKIFIGKGWILGNKVLDSVQVGGWSQSNDLTSIVDSYMIWVLMQFGIIGFTLYVSYFFIVIHQGFKKNVSTSITIVVLYIFLSSMKLYPFFEKSSYFIVFFLIGLLRNQLVFKPPFSKSKQVLEISDN